MPMRIIIVGILLAVFHFPMNAQQKCETRIPAYEIHPRRVDGLNDRSENYVIPVIFHIYWSESLEPIAPSRVNQVVNEVNEMLTASNPEIESVPSIFQPIVEDAELELQFARQLPGNECTGGIIYHYHDFNQGSLEPFENSIETSHYLNIHVFPNNTSYATFPAPSQFQNDPADFIVLSTFDMNFRIELLAHEIGHWLGLYHTFGQVNETGGECGDDFVEDTPITRGSLECDTNLIDCTPDVLENVHNFMDYTDCGSMFTTGQVERMHGVLEDPNLNRIQIHQPENIEYTGAGQPSTCGSVVQFWQKALPECDSTLVQYSYLLEGDVPDSVLWEFQSPEYFTTTAHSPDKYFSESGQVNISLHLYYGAETQTVSHVHFVEVTEPQTDLPPIPSFPLVLDPDNGFALPNDNMNLLNAAPDENWQVCDFAGYQSDQCIYVPARIVNGEGFADLEMGIFDMTDLVEPTISFEVAAAMVQQGAFHTLQILFRDECSSTFIGDIWYSTSLFDIANGITASGFIPSSDNQWVSVNTTFPSWINSGYGVITIRLKTNMSPGFSGEPFYIDNFRIGDPEDITFVREINLKDLELFPNPAFDRLNWKSSGNGKHLKVLDALGRVVFEKTTNAPSGNLDVSDWLAGVYYFSLESDRGMETGRFVVE